MKLKSPFHFTLLLTVILFLLAIYVAVVEVPQGQKAKQAEQNADRLFSFESNAVRSVLLRYPADEILLEKSDNGTWHLTRPLQTEADPREVQSLISTISDLRFTRVVEEQITNPAEFGLSHPHADIRLTLPDRTERLLIGDDGPMANSLYVERDSDQRVVLTQPWIKNSLTRTVFDLRTKVILPIKHAEVDQLRLDFPKESLQLTKEDDHWFLKKPVEDRADEEVVSALLLTIENLRATSFVDPGPDLEKVTAGLKKPLVVVTLRQGPASYTARFYNAPEVGSVYVVTGTEKPIYRVAQFTMDELPSELFHYQDKHLITFKTESVKGLEIRTPSERFTLAMGNNGWVISGEAQPVHSDRVKRILEQLENLRTFQSTEKPVRDPATVGLKPPVYEIRLTDQARQTLAVLRFGNELKGMLYAQGNTTLGIVLVNKDFLDEIPRKSELLKKEEPKKEGPAKDKGN